MASFVPVLLACAIFNPPSGVDQNLSPVVFMHGTCESKETWGDIPKIVANVTRRKVYAVDARNHGDTEWTDFFSYDTNGDDLLHFLDTIKAKKAIIVGHSMGGLAVIKAALTQPERIEKVVVEDISVRPLDKDVIDVLVRYLTAIQKQTQQITPEMNLEEAQNFIFQGISSILEEIFGRPNSKRGEIYKIPMRRRPDGRFAPKANVEAILNSIKGSEKLIPDLKGLYDGPIRFIYGKLSPFQVGADKEEIRKFFPKAELVAIENATHLVHSDRPQEFTEALLKFLS